MFIFRTKLGWVGVEESSAGICRVVIPRRGREIVEEGKGFSGSFVPAGEKTVPGTTKSMQDLIKEIRNYLNGKNVRFDYPLDLRKLSPFAVEVLMVAKSIPYGETRSYSWVAERTGGKKFARAVGQALARNPVPILIPCHRVIRASGDTGGFTGGLMLKKKLLNMEKYWVTVPLRSSLKRIRKEDGGGNLLIERGVVQKHGLKRSEPVQF